MNMLLENFDLVATAPEGIARLRRLILETAVRGKLVPHDPADEPAVELLAKIKTEKARLEKEGIIKARKDILEIDENEVPFVLPKGWVWTKLGDITNFGTTEKPERIDNSIWVLDLEDIEKETSRLLRRTSQEAKQSLSDKNIFKSGDVLYGKLRPYLNKVIVADQDGVCTTEIIPFHCYSTFSPHYFRIVMMSPDFLKYANKLSYGMKMPRLGTEDVRRYPFPLPPLAEQFRIATKVQELMAVLDRLEVRASEAEKGRGHAVKAITRAVSRATTLDELVSRWRHLAGSFDQLVKRKEDVKALREMILELAIKGRLVPQDSADEPASVLLSKIKAEKLRLIKVGSLKTEKELPEVDAEEPLYILPEGWVWTRLGFVAKKITDGTHHSPPNSSSGDFPYISAKNIKQYGLDLSNVTYVTKQIHSEIYARCDPEFGDILYIKDGATTGITAINTLSNPFSMLSSVALIKPSSGTENKYIHLVLQAPFFFNAMRKGMTGVAITRVTLEKLNMALFPLPPLAEQSRIVSRVNELMGMIDYLEQRLHQKEEATEKYAEAVTKLE